MYECKKTCALRRTFVNDHEVGMSIFIHLADAAEQETHACILIETLTLAWLSISDYIHNEVHVCTTHSRVINTSSPITPISFPLAECIAMLTEVCGAPRRNKIGS